MTWGALDTGLSRVVSQACRKLQGLPAARYTRRFVAPSTTRRCFLNEGSQVALQASAATPGGFLQANNCSGWSRVRHVPSMCVVGWVSRKPRGPSIEVRAFHLLRRKAGPSVRQTRRRGGVPASGLGEAAPTLQHPDHLWRRFIQDMTVSTGIGQGVPFPQQLV